MSKRTKLVLIIAAVLVAIRLLSRHAPDARLFKGVEVMDAGSVAALDTIDLTPTVFYDGRLLIWAGKGKLVWRVDGYDTVSIIDAHTGETLDQWSNVQDEVPLLVQTYDSNNCRVIPGTLVLENDTWVGLPDEIEGGTHVVMRSVVDFYAGLGWRGYDGGGKASDTVHSGINNGFTCDQDNAAYYPLYNHIIFGDGTPPDIMPLGLSPDIAAHEMGHAVIYYRITWADGRPRGLDYHDQSGAMNEGLADFFGAMIENDWVMGEHAWVTRGGLRDLENPGRWGYPSHMIQYVNNGNQGYMVHWNCTIIGHALYLVAQRLGNEAALSLVWAALPKLPGAAMFTDLRRVMVAINPSVAPDFDAVGIGGNSPTPTTKPSSTPTPRPTLAPTATPGPRPTYVPVPTMPAPICKACLFDKMCPPGYFCKLSGPCRFLCVKKTSPNSSCQMCK
jgi:hypothetical protein